MTTIGLTKGIISFQTEVGGVGEQQQSSIIQVNQ